MRAGGVQTGGLDGANSARVASPPDPKARGQAQAPAYEEEDDGVLVEKLRRGESGALGVLWKRYAALLYTQAARILKNPSETEDVVVEVFEEAWKRVESYRPERARPVAWLLTLVRRRAIDRLRERRSHQRAEEGLQQQELLSGGEEGRSLVEEQVRLGDLRGVLEEALGDLPKEQRLTVCLVYYEGCTQREISERMRAPIGTVKSRLEMGLRKLREALRRREAGYPGEWDGGMSSRWQGLGAVGLTKENSAVGKPFWRRALSLWTGALGQREPRRTQKNAPNDSHSKAQSADSQPPDSAGAESG